MKDVSIIILNYKSKGLVRQHLLQLRENPPRASHEVIVVDNHSEDSIAEMIAADFPAVRCIESAANKGYAAGNNMGIRESTGRYIVILNPDLVLTPGIIDALYEAMERDERIGMLGPKILDPDGTMQYSCVRFPDIWLPLFRRTFFARTPWGMRWHRWYFMQDWAHDEPRDVEWLFGACCIVRRRALDAVGFLDERFFLYLEDTDWCRRFWRAGWRVRYDPTIAVVHLLGRHSGGDSFTILFNKHARHHLRSFIKYLFKYAFQKPPYRAED